jgi:hypothetical protein
LQALILDAQLYRNAIDCPEQIALFAKQPFLGTPTNACIESFVFAEFLRKTG